MMQSIESIIQTLTSGLDGQWVVSLGSSPHDLATSKRVGIISDQWKPTTHGFVFPLILITLE